MQLGCIKQTHNCYHCSYYRCVQSECLKIENFESS